MSGLHKVQGGYIWFTQRNLLPSPGCIPSSVDVFLLIMGFFHQASMWELGATRFCPLIYYKLSSWQQPNDYAAM